MTKTTFSLRLHLLLLLLLPPLYASAQEWTTRVGEVRKEQATTSRIGRNHAEEGLSDEELAEFVCRNSINTMCDIICGGWCNAVATLKKSADEMCKEIVIKWLQQPVEGGDG